MLKRYKTGIHFAYDSSIISNRIDFGSNYVCFDIANQDDSISCVIDNPDYDYYEIIVCTDVTEEAICILDLICSCQTICDSSQLIDLQSIVSNILLNDNSDSVMALVTAKKLFLPDGILYHSCLMASKAYGSAAEQNAVLKYSVMRDLFDIHPMDLEPGFELPYLRLPSIQARYATAIIGLYSILEELKLNVISAKQDNESTDGKIDYWITEGLFALKIKSANLDKTSVDGKTGKWNPVCLSDIQNRLKNKNIDPYSKICWIVRGPQKRPFKNKTIDTSSLCPWSDGEDVRDFFISVTDAILETSFIRSKKASHGARGRLYELSHYDVENAYALTRYILMQYFECNINFE